jgi:ABC-type lipoprotein release transport system permease subunit
VRSWAPRVNTFALLSLGDASRGVALVGVDPRRELTLTALADRVAEGRFLSEGGDREIVLGRELARRLGAQLGDRLLVFTQAYSLESAYELFTLVGSLRLPEAGLERGLALVALRDAQELLVYGDRISEIGLLAGSGAEARALRDGLRASLGEGGLTGGPVEVREWSELMPELDQLLELDSLGMYLMLLILIVVVGFGILNTILMSVLERRRELGVMMALGLRASLAVRIVFVESLMLAGVGLVLGLAVAVPLVLYMQWHPIPITGEISAAWELFGTDPVMVGRLTLANPVGSSLLILAVAALAAWYPAFKAGRGRPVDAMASL